MNLIIIYCFFFSLLLLLFKKKRLNQLVEDEDCSPYYVPSRPIIGRCVPIVKKESGSERVFEKLKNYKELDIDKLTWDDIKSSS